MFAELLQKRAEEDGDRPFLLYRDAVVTWSQAVDTVARLASVITGRGIGPGDHVLVAAGNGPTFLYSWFALRWVGAVCIPLHTGATGAALAAIADSARIQHAIGEPEFRDHVVNAVPRLAEGYLSLEATDGTCPEAADHPRADPVLQGPLDVCSILYTSGTTGTPKGVVLSEASFVDGGRHLAERVAVTADDRLLIGLPLFHTNPQVYGVMVALNTGCSLALLREFRPAEFLADAARYEATGFTYVGTLLNLVLARTVEFPETRLRFCIGGGASPQVWTDFERSSGALVHELYGMTELGGWVTATGVEDRKVGWCGRSRPDVDVAIVDDHDDVLPFGELGEIVVRPKRPGVIFDGYHQDSDRTWQRMRNLWFHTGDLGRMDADGYLSFHGRGDDMIRRGGENIEPAAVQIVVEAHPSVDEAAVVGVTDEMMGQEVKVIVKTVPGVLIDVDDLVAFWSERLPKFARPRYLEIRGSLPKTATQKVVVQELLDIGGDVLDLRSHGIEAD